MPRIRNYREPPFGNGHREPEKSWAVEMPASVHKAAALFAADRGWTKRMVTLWAFREAGLPVPEDEIVDGRIAANQLEPEWRRGPKRPTR